MSASDSTTVIGEERLLIDGELRPARTGRVFPTVNPATGEVLGVAAMPPIRCACSMRRWTT